MKDMMNNTILLKFPETLWNTNVGKGNIYELQQWHPARWVADIMPYISMQTIGKFYAFITKDPVTSIYIAQGFYIAIYFTCLAWIVSLYIKTFLKISLYSHHFLLILFCCGALFIISDFPSNWNSFS